MIAVTWDYQASGAGGSATDWNRIATTAWLSRRLAMGTSPAFSIDWI